jgi:P2 family phage contractile tail tube protein
MIPQTLFNMNMFVDGISLQGDVPSLSLPKLTVKTEAYRAGGMDGEVDMDQGLEKMESSFTTNGIRKQVMKFFGLSDGTAFKSVFRGSYQEQTGAKLGVIATIRGRLRECDPGEWKPGEKGEFKYAVSVSYYKLEIGGAVMFEIDPVNMIRIIDGVDQLAEHRENLGL